MKGTVRSLAAGLIMLVSTASLMVKPDPMQELLRSALERYQQGRYYDALHFYQKVLSMDSTESEAHYYLGECYRYLFQYERALAHYQQIQPARSSEYPLLYVNLGLVHKSLGNYDQAEQYFQSFILDSHPSSMQDHPYWIEKAKRELRNLLAVQEAPFTPEINAKISKLPAPLNSASHDLAAVPYREPDMVMVTSTRPDSKGNQYHDQHGESFSDNFLFVQDSGHWQDISETHQFSATNTSLDEGPGVISSDQQTYYFTRYTAKGDFHIFASTFEHQRWKPPHPLPAPVNLPGYVSKHPALSASGDTLFFASNRPGGYGGSDLWMSIRKQETWQPPVNLGFAFNTPDHETSPHWNARQRILFFASDGHPGSGGYDLFMATVSPDQETDQVVNLGKPLNSTKDDTYIWTGEKRGYITSNRDSTGGFDVFMYEYSSEPKLLLSLTSESFWDTWAARLLSQLTEEEEGEAHTFFSSLPIEEQEVLQRTVRRRIFQALQADDRISQAMVDEAQLMPTTEQDNIQQLVDDQLAFYLSFQFPSWSEDTRQWFSMLSTEEKDRIERTTQLLVLKALLQVNDASSPEEAFAYEVLSSQQRTWVEQASERGIRYFREAASELVTLDELYQWQTLSPEEKDQLHRELGYRYFTGITLADDSQDDIHYHYEQLPLEKKQQIDRLAYALVVGGSAADTVGLNESAWLLDTLSSEEQRALARLVVYRSQALRKASATGAKADIHSWEELPAEEKNTLRRAVATRRFARQVISDFTVAPQEQRQSINLHSVLQSNPEIVTVRGKVRQGHLMDKPIAVSLGGMDKRLCTKTQQDGTFIFEQVNYHQSQQLFIGEKENSMSEMLSFYLEELEITVVQDSQFVASFDNIYFETNEHHLPEEAIPVLERVVKFHQHHPDVTIQIHAYADSVGSQTFNYQLSERRGESVFQSLVQRGVHPERLNPVPKGRESLDPSKALSYSRRVEFKITGVNTSYNPTRKIYLLAAKPDLNTIADRYGVSLDQILALNPGLPAHPSPYTIIQIVTNQESYAK